MPDASEQASETGDLRVTRDVGVARGPSVAISFDGAELNAFEGETVAAALMAAGRRVLRRTAGTGAPRGVFCGMGVCYDCLVVIDDAPSQRACMIEVRDGMRIRSQAGPRPRPGPG
jgi:predicted molibdopterin-dependent oxidoreductase YjgC